MVGYYHIGSNVDSTILCGYHPLSVCNNFYWKMSWMIISNEN